MKYAIVVDSSCGVTKEQAEKLGWHFLPLHIIIDGIDYADGVNINSEILFEKFNLKSDIKTSMYGLQDIYDTFEKLSLENDMVFVYPISQFLSNSCATATIIQKEFPKVKVIQSKQVDALILLDIVWFDYMMKKDPSNYEEYVKKLEIPFIKNSTTLIPKYNKYLVKGGRLNSATAAIARLLKIVPLIKWEDGKLIKEAIGKNFLKSALNNIRQKAENIEDIPGTKKIAILLKTGNKKEEYDEFMSELNKYSSSFKFFERPLAPVIMIHTGPEAYCLITANYPAEAYEYLVRVMNYLK
ncbi:DegV family protein [Mycoplasma tauri]|uniref:DegV family protein n=1 Tax=Mycoplasma tauri TaxID=547987 RepID=UPI001967DA41|nr:DegV family protein [Mycoplasma tauri]MBZ4203421.1 DegV family protein [Mycoplasma tauri]MBZ4217978.1 DegV family protein [Mycoplasma tauri]QSB07493.1 DegV family protein [Mycoplasma tauri]